MPDKVRINSDAPLGYEENTSARLERARQERAVVSDLWLSFLHRMFIGQNGIRPGWRLLLYAAMTGVILLALAQIAQRIHPDMWSQTWLLAASESLTLIAALAAAWIMSRIEHRPLGAYGLPALPASWRRFWAGTAWGIASLSLLMLTLRGLGAFYFGGPAGNAARTAIAAALYALLFVVVGFSEEFLLRGYAQFTLAQAIGFWPSAGLLSIAFGVIHLRNGGEGWLGIITATLFGLFFAFTLRRTGTLWFAVGVHAAWDWGQSYLYSVPDSGILLPGHMLNSSIHGPAWLTGGSVGPEGSVLALILIALIWLVLHRRYPEVKYQTASGC